MLRFFAAMLLFLATVASQAQQPAQRMANTRVADGFDFPVGKPNGEGYYKHRGYSPGRHMGEDWNGTGGGDTDLGAPVYSTAHGLCVMARNASGAWGNLVIIRHVFLNKNRFEFADSVYAHLHKITVREGQQILRGQQVGTIGTAGRFTAHLHFEIRTAQGLGIGFNQRGNPQGYSHYHSPTSFIEKYRPPLAGAGRAAAIPIYTFSMPQKSSPAVPWSSSTSPTRIQPTRIQPTPTPHSFKVNRF